MPIFHLATAADWDAARRSGRYTTSTRGRSLADEGFIHASRADQWQGVRERFYADVTEPLVLLVIDPDRLEAPVIEEPGDPADAGGETFPHVYGAIPVAAVTKVIPLDATAPPPASTPASTPVTARPEPAVTVEPPRPDAGRTFLSLFLEEMSMRAGLGLVVIVVSVALCLLVRGLAGDLAALVAIAISLTTGLLVVQRVLRRREGRRR